MNSEPAKAKPAPLLGFLALIIPFGFGVILLSNFTFNASTNFNSVLIFAVVAGFSFMFTWALNKDNTGISWHDSPELKDFLYFVAVPTKRLGPIKYLPFGYPAILFFAITVPIFVHDVAGILIAVGIGGVIMAVQLLKTKSIFVPWITHASYNITAVLLSSMSILPLAASPIFVPFFSDLPSPGTIANIGSQIMLQLIAVSLSEEILKISAAVGLYILLGKRFPRGAMMFSIIMWTLMHSIFSYRVSLPF